MRIMYTMTVGRAARACPGGPAAPACSEDAVSVISIFKELFIICIYLSRAQGAPLLLLAMRMNPELHLSFCWW